MRGVRKAVRRKIKTPVRSSSTAVGAEWTPTRKWYLCDVHGMSPEAYERGRRKARNYQEVREKGLGLEYTEEPGV
jgi:hypothetical protein